MLRELNADLHRYLKMEGSWLRVITNTAVWGVTTYRLGHWLFKEAPPSPILLPLKAAYLIINKTLEATTEMFLDAQADIGPGLYIGHSGGVHINNATSIGENCGIGHQVTIGTSAGGRAGAPVIGNDVYIGTGAKVIGKIKIGDGAKISANSLVMTNVPAGATVMGVPARIIMRSSTLPEVKP